MPLNVNLRFFQARPNFPMFLCLSDKWRLFEIGLVVTVDTSVLCSSTELCIVMAKYLADFKNVESLMNNSEQDVPPRIRGYT